MELLRVSIMLALWFITIVFFFVGGILHGFISLLVIALFGRFIYPDKPYYHPNGGRMVDAVMPPESRE